MPVILPKEEVDRGKYKYGSCPINKPPMDSNTFMHYFYSPAWKHQDVMWGPRLPKKVNGRLSEIPQPLAQGWGIQIEEGPHWAHITTLILVFLIVSGVVAGVYGCTGGTPEMRRPELPSGHG